MAFACRQALFQNGLPAAVAVCSQFQGLLLWGVQESGCASTPANTEVEPGLVLTKAVGRAVHGVALTANSLPLPGGGDGGVDAVAEGFAIDRLGEKPIAASGQASLLVFDHRVGRQSQDRPLNPLAGVAGGPVTVQIGICMSIKTMSNGLPSAVAESAISAANLPLAATWTSAPEFFKIIPNSRCKSGASSAISTRQSSDLTCSRAVVLLVSHRRHFSGQRVRCRSSRRWAVSDETGCLCQSRFPPRCGRRQFRQPLGDGHPQSRAAEAASG